VILQQTRVDQGSAYYHKFTEQFPTVEALAAADEEQVLKLWQGLGYYSRARNLHKTAMEVVERFGGNFPASYVDLLSLRGIGPYTAAAIASFAFDLQHAVVDGNVYRVLSRYYGIDTPMDSTEGKKIFQQLATDLIPADAPAEFNQAIMEFGALYCTPANPDCEHCVLFDSCASGRNGLWKQRPLKSKKTNVRDRYFHYFHLEADGRIAVNKREAKDVWQHLYEFPMLETETAELQDSDLAGLGLSPERIARIFESKHILSHQRIYAVFYQLNDVTAADLTAFNPVDLAAFHELPIHRLMHRYVEKHL
jgi:A/G-specific adenine glycosylase